jgi:NAD(P)-dependent dehydrogenase (short-subunit alcohol dehydrogenase family)
MNQSTEELGESLEESPKAKASDERPVGPQVWFMTDGLSPVAISLTRKLLAKGDSVVLGVEPKEVNGERGEGLKDLVDEVDEGADDDEEEDKETRTGQGEEENEGDEDEPRQKTSRKGWSERFRVLPFDARRAAQAQSTIAEAVDIFGRLDILLLCRSEGLSYVLFSETSLTWTSRSWNGRRARRRHANSFSCR